MQESIRIFISYAEEDGRHRKNLETHLSLLRDQGLITITDRHSVRAGSNVAHEIDRLLNAAQIILLLVSSDFMSSYRVELDKAMARQHDARVIPILLRPVSLKGTSIELLKTLPTDDLTITTWKPQDAAWAVVADVIRETVQELRTETSENDLWERFMQCSQKPTHRFLQDIENTPGLLGSFVPELYIQRIEVENILTRFLMSNSQALTLVGDSGVGKTHLLCAWTKQLLQDSNIVFLYNCGSFISPDVTDLIARDLSISRNEVAIYLAKISQAAASRKKQCILIFDAINEFRSTENTGPDMLLKYINNLVDSLPERYIRVVISCTASTWRYLGTSGIGMLFSSGRYFRPTANDFTVRLQTFTLDELELAYNRYHTFFKLQTPYNRLPVTVRSMLRHPVILRLLAEIYRDRNVTIIREASLLQIFQRLYEEQVQDPRERFFCEKLSAEMLSQHLGALSVDDLMNHELLGSYILEQSLDSTYRCLQKKGIVTVVTNNESVGSVLKFTYDRLGGYILVRHLLRQQTSRGQLILELIEGFQKFSLAWDTARTLLVLWKDLALFSTFAQSTDARLRQLVVQSLVDVYGEDPAWAIDTAKLLIQKDSQEAQQTALKAAYSIASGAQDIFLWAATKGTSNLRQTTKNILYLIWRSDPQFAYDLILEVQKQIEIVLQLLSLPHLLRPSVRNTLRNTLAFVLDLLTTIYINHCHQEDVIADLDRVFYAVAKESLGLDKLPLDKLARNPISRPIFKAINSSFAKPNLDTILLADLQDPKHFFSIPARDRECLERIAVFLDPQTNIYEAENDLVTMLQSDIMFFHTAVALVLAIHAYRNFPRVEPFLRALFEKANGQGRLWMLFSFCIPGLDTPPEWLGIVEDFTNVLIEKHPTIFYKEEKSPLNWCDFALLPLGLIYGKQGTSILFIEHRLQQALEQRDQRMLERYITGLGTTGFYFPQAVFSTLLRAISQWNETGLEHALVESLSFIRALHFDDVDSFLSQIGANEDLRHLISSKTDVELVGRQVYGVGLLHNAVHLCVFAPKMRNSFSMEGLRTLAKARKPNDFISAFSLTAIIFVYETGFRVTRWFDPE